MTVGADPDAIREFDRDLEVKYDWEMSPFELRRETARRMAKQTGAFQGQAEALKNMGMAKS